MRDRWRNFWRNFLRNEKAQATVEYTLLLAIAIGVLLIVVRKLIKPGLERLSLTISKRLDDMLTKGDLHRIRLSR